MPTSVLLLRRRSPRPAWSTAAHRPGAFPGVPGLAGERRSTKRARTKSSVDDEKFGTVRRFARNESRRLSRNLSPAHLPLEEPVNATPPSLTGPMRLIVVAIAATICMCVFGFAVSSANAAPLTEVEPNDSVFTANGPIPADGYLATYSTSNDADYAYTYLQPQRQVTISLTYVSGCNPGITYAAPWGVEALDYLGRSRFTYSDSRASTKTWTTPDEPVRMNFLFQKANKIGCQILFQVSPSDAVFAGPLPPVPPRDIAPDTTKPLIAGSKNSLPLTGSAWDGDSATARLVPVANGQCPGAIDSPEDAADYPERWLVSMPTGVFAESVKLEAARAGRYFLCTWMTNPSAQIAPILTSKRVVVIRRGTARLATKSVKRGKRLSARIKHVKDFVEFRFSRKGKLVKKFNARVRKGKASVPTSKLPAATYKLAIYGNGVRIAKATVWIRRH